GDHSQQRACHHHREVGAELSSQSRQSGRKRHHLQICVYNQRPHQISICKHRGEHCQRSHRSFGQRRHYFYKSLPLVASVQIGSLRNLIRNPHICLPQEKGSKSADNSRKDQCVNRIRQSQL